MVKQKIVLKLALDDERKRRKAFKAAVGMAGVTSATMEGDKIIIIGDGVDPITLTTMLRRGLGYAELLSVSSGDDKKKDGYGPYGYGGEKKKDGYGEYGYGGEKKKDGYGYGGADGATARRVVVPRAAVAAVEAATLRMRSRTLRTSSTTPCRRRPTLSTPTRLLLISIKNRIPVAA